MVESILTMDQLHVSGSILMKLLIECDVTAGGPVCPQKHIAVDRKKTSHQV